MDYAVLKLSGKQYKVSEGDVLEVTRLPNEKSSKFEVTDVLLSSIGGEIKVGTPLVDKTGVEFEVVDHFRGPKIEIMRFKSKVRYRKHTGFRQEMTRLKVNKINAPAKLAK